jgi:DNA-binding transcriptional LysR family regulator
MLENFDRLKVFYYVYSLKSISAAAKSLYVSQSAVSQSVLKLEAELKSPLFIRLHKQLIPTSTGEGLYTIIKPFMSELDDFLKNLNMAKDFPFGELRIGAPPEFGKAYMSSIMAAFRQQFPEVTFTLNLGTPENLLPMLKKGEIDFILVDEFLTKSSFIGNLDIFLFEPVAAEEIVLACSKQYYEGFINGDNSFINISSLDFISYRKDKQLIKQWFKHHFSKGIGKYKNVLTVDNQEAVISAIKHNMGLGIISSQMVKEELRKNEIFIVSVSDSEIINKISLLQLQDKIPGLTEKTFTKFLVEQIEMMISREKWKTLK